MKGYLEGKSDNKWLTIIPYNQITEVSQRTTNSHLTEALIVKCANKSYPYLHGVSQENLDDYFEYLSQIHSQPQGLTI